MISVAPNTLAHTLLTLIAANDGEIDSAGLARLALPAPRWTPERFKHGPGAYRAFLAVRAQHRATVARHERATKAQVSRVCSRLQEAGLVATGGRVEIVPTPVRAVRLITPDHGLPRVEFVPTSRTAVDEVRRLGAAGYLAGLEGFTEPDEEEPGTPELQAAILTALLNGPLTRPELCKAVTGKARASGAFGRQLRAPADLGVISLPRMWRLTSEGWALVGAQECAA